VRQHNGGEGKVNLVNEVLRAVTAMEGGDKTRAAVLHLPRKAGSGKNKRERGRVVLAVRKPRQEGYRYPTRERKGENGKGLALYVEHDLGAEG